MTHGTICVAWLMLHDTCATLQDVHERLALRKLGTLSRVVETAVAVDRAAIHSLWHSFGVVQPPTIPFLDQFPSYVILRLLKAAERVDLSQGEVVIEAGKAVDGIFVILAGTVDFHSRRVSAARDVALV
jgi:hypothetical protein